MKQLFALVASLAVAGTIFLGSASGVAAAGDARIRVLHASPDAPAVDVYADGSRILSNVSFGAISTYLTVPAGQHHLQVFATGTTTGAVIDAQVTLEAGHAYTVAATGPVAKIEAQVLADNPTPTTGKAQVRAVHLSADAPAVDVAPRGSAADAALVKGLVYPKATAYLALNPGTYTLDVRLAGTTTVALALPTLDVAAGTSYSVFVIGSAANPPLGANGLRAVVAVDAKAAAPAPSATLPPTSTAPGTSTTSPSLPVVPLAMLFAALAIVATTRRVLARERVQR